MIRPDALRLGLDCTPEGVVVDGKGERSAFLYTIGPPAKGVFWEMTSVPEIRVAAQRLAGLLVSAPMAVGAGAASGTVVGAASGREASLR
jgi:uncharacterized NAD(P)/FAD-binding protein YdhS